MSAEPGVQVRRIYEEPSEADGTRVLVDRLWPRGVSKEQAHLDEWCKAVAPSADLRVWYGHIPDRYPEFEARYTAELEGPEQSAALQRLCEIAEAGTLTLLTATKDPGISEAAVLARLIRERREADR
jgi:uncharacterized protein YeaO (DUF488 family)